MAANRFMLAAAAFSLAGCAAGAGSRQLGGGEWRAVDINGVPVIAGSVLTLRLEDGRVSGSSGCNRYSGTFTRSSRERIRFGPLSSTRMACADPALTEQENRFTSILTAVEGYSVYGDGGISLIAADGRAIRFRRGG